MIKKYPYNRSKTQVECYKFRAEGAPYWADVTIDTTPGAKHGRISIASDFGSWSYYWGACGESFKKFLAGLDKWYVAKNFGADKFFDVKATIAAYRSQITTCVFEREEVTATELEVNDLMETPHLQEFVEQVRKSPRIMAMYDGMPDTCYRLDPGFENFWEHIWPLLLDAFKEEEQPTMMDVDQFNKNIKDILPLTEELTLAFLQNEANHGRIFATGVVNEPVLHTQPVRWIAKVGDGFHDWAIYYHNESETIGYIKAYGNKVTTDGIIRKLVPCTDEALNCYRR